MADRGMGIRLFNSKESLQDIFEEFEDVGDEGSDDQNAGTAVVTSQLRHFVVQVDAYTCISLCLASSAHMQEYISEPLLLDPFDITLNGTIKPRKPAGHKVKTTCY